LFSSQFEEKMKCWLQENPQVGISLSTWAYMPLNDVRENTDRTDIHWKSLVLRRKIFKLTFPTITKSMVHSFRGYPYTIRYCLFDKWETNYFICDEPPARIASEWLKCAYQSLVRKTNCELVKNIDQENVKLIGRPRKPPCFFSPITRWLLKTMLCCIALR
jgi:hypothetical protein